MKKDELLDFVKWYIKNREKKNINDLKLDDVRYISHFFRYDKIKFIKELEEYAINYKKAYGYNPFIIKDDLDVHIKKMENDLYEKNTSFYDYSENINNHMPRAILGKNNYIKFLKEKRNG